MSILSATCAMSDVSAAKAKVMEEKCNFQKCSDPESLAARGYMYQCLPGFEIGGEKTMAEITAGTLIRWGLPRNKVVF